MLFAIASLPQQQLWQTAYGIEQIACHEELDAAQKHRASVCAAAVGHAYAHGKHEDGSSKHTAVDVVQAILESLFQTVFVPDIDKCVNEHHPHDGYKLGEVERPLSAGVDLFFAKQSCKHILKCFKCETCYKIHALTGGVGNELPEQRQRERVGDLDVLGGAQREVSHAEAIGGIVV